MLQYANRPCADMFIKLSIWGTGQFCGSLGNNLIEAELKSLLPLYEEKHYACGLQLVGGRKKWWSWGPNAFRGQVGKGKEGMGLRKDESCSFRVTLFSFPLRNFNSND